MSNLESSAKTERILPAVLVKTRQDLIFSINRIKPYVKTIHIDIMDNVFVPNRTISIPDLKSLPQDTNYEFHWMVNNPEKWISEIKEPHTHLVHAETIESWDAIKNAAESSGGILGIAINPETSVESIQEYIPKVNKFLVMTVHPGFSNQKYIPGVESKIKSIRKLKPSAEIEVDGGINFETIASARAAGANRFASASTIFSAQDPKEAIRKLHELSSEWYAI